MFMNFTLIKNEEIQLQSNKVEMQISQHPLKCLLRTLLPAWTRGEKDRAAAEAGFILPSSILEVCISLLQFSKNKTALQ